MCLGYIQDQRAFGPLVKALQHGDVLEPGLPISNRDKERHPVSGYAALALGYLGNENAIDPLIQALNENERSWAIDGLTMLRSPRAIRPIIECASACSELDDHVHRCLAYITQSHLPITISRTTGKSTVATFPELGELEPAQTPQALWQHWLKGGGDRYAKQQFEKYYPVWKRALLERPQDPDEPDSGYKGILYRMIGGGIAALPYLMSRIEQGDASLLWAVESLRQGRLLDFNRDELPPEIATCAAGLKWWRENKETWSVFDSDKK